MIEKTRNQRNKLEEKYLPLPYLSFQFIKIPISYLTHQNISIKKLSQIICVILGFKINKLSLHEGLLAVCFSKVTYANVEDEVTIGREELVLNECVYRYIL
jgi:hypothetical protein